MSSISLVHGNYCGGANVGRRIADTVQLRIVEEAHLVKRAAALSGLSEDRLRSAFSARTSVFNAFTRERERALAYLRLAVAEEAARDGMLLFGLGGLLVPKTVGHLLRVCLVAGPESRSAEALSRGVGSKKEALQRIQKHDQGAVAWVERLFKKRDPWDPSLYDIVIPVDRSSPEAAVALIQENLLKPAVQPTPDSLQAAEDFLLAAKVEVELAEEGHFLAVDARGGRVVLTILKRVMMLGRLEEELRGIVEKIEGVKGVTTQVGKEFYQADVYRKFDFQMPAKVLLVDDERELVQTLSERLKIRDVGSAMAFDGESALRIVEEDDPEIMILDIRMPGIDGIEVLKRVKETRPAIEVIMLTGHGSEEDRKTCLALGAFAYLQKPVDIDLLSRKIMEANEKVKKSKG